MKNARFVAQITTVVLVWLLLFAGYLPVFVPDGTLSSFLMSVSNLARYLGFVLGLGTIYVGCLALAAGLASLVWYLVVGWLKIMFGYLPYQHNFVWVLILTGLGFEVSKLPKSE